MTKRKPTKSIDPDASIVDVFSGHVYPATGYNPAEPFAEPNDVSREYERMDLRAWGFERGPDGEIRRIPKQDQ